MLRYQPIALIFALIVIGGCSTTVDPMDALAKTNDTNLKRLASLYRGFQRARGQRGPADEAAFKAYIEGMKRTRLERIGIDPANIDALFNSERDGEPFKIRYGVPGSAMGSSEAVVFESIGVDGVRRVGFLNMTQRDVEPAEYESLLSRAIQSAPQQRRIDPSEFTRVE